MTASPGDGEHAAREGYYPDPSIPGYVRYWNGVSWVPGTSRPAAPAPADETGPLFLDQTSVTEALPEPEPAARRAPEPEPEPVPRTGVERAEEPVAWQADPAQQSGFGGPRDRRVSWGGPAEPEPVLDPGREPDTGREPARSTGVSLGRGPRQEPQGVPVAGVPAARTPTAAAAAAASAPADRFPAQAPAGRGSAEGVGILSVRSPVSPAASEWPEAPGATASGITSAWPEAAPRAASAAVRAPQAASGAPAAAAPPTAAPQARQSALRSEEPRPTARRPEEPGHGSLRSEEPRRALRSEEPRPKVSEEPAAPRPEESARPPKATPREVFERMAERAVRPAGFFRRAVARALDSLVLGAVAAGAAWPLVPDATAHLQAKVDAAQGSGQTTTVWLLDATIAGYLGMVLGAVLLFGVFYEVLPTARWGRTPGKKLLGVRVLATAGLRPPGFGAALRRWLVLALLGVPGGLWCLVDRPRRQAWHDKAAKTYVAR